MGLGSALFSPLLATEALGQFALRTFLLLIDPLLSAVV